MAKGKTGRGGGINRATKPAGNPAALCYLCPRCRVRSLPLSPTGRNVSQIRAVAVLGARASCCLL